MYSEDEGGEDSDARESNVVSAMLVVVWEYFGDVLFIFCSCFGEVLVMFE